MKRLDEYDRFIERKSQLAGNFGFDPVWIPDQAFDFQKHLIEWICRKGRGAVFADCGMGKTLMQLSWCENVHRKTGKPVLLLTPLAVGAQTVKEAERFGMHAARSFDGKVTAPITVANYQKLHLFNEWDFAGVCCDESSILKSFDGVTKQAVTEFARKMQFRSLWTATAAPNDHIELGTSSEALGYLGFMDMLNRFFKKAEATTSRSQEYRSGLYRFRGHGERDFWRWIASWARAIRKPSDLGFADDGFILPQLITNQYTAKPKSKPTDYLFDMPAVTLEEQRNERTRTLNERSELAASLVSDTGKSAVCWCHTNNEGDLLEKLIPDAVQVSGKDSDEKKEELFTAFANGEARVLVSKPVVAGFGLNWQHCSHQTFFPSHSFEQWYQAIRRSWRFGQKNPVVIDVITTEAESRVLGNMQSKARAAEEMFKSLINHINNELVIAHKNTNQTKEDIPSWLSNNK
jgi:hypothetical protein